MLAQQIDRVFPAGLWIWNTHGPLRALLSRWHVRGNSLHIGSRCTCLPRCLRSFFQGSTYAPVIRALTCGFGDSITMPWASRARSASGEAPGARGVDPAFRAAACTAQQPTCVPYIFSFNTSRAPCFKRAPLNATNQEACSARVSVVSRYACLSALVGGLCPVLVGERAAESPWTLCFATAGDTGVCASNGRFKKKYTYRRRANHPARALVLIDDIHISSPLHRASFEAPLCWPRQLSFSKKNKRRKNRCLFFSELLHSGRWPRLRVLLSVPLGRAPLIRKAVLFRCPSLVWATCNGCRAHYCGRSI